MGETAPRIKFRKPVTRRQAVLITNGTTRLQKSLVLKPHKHAYTLLQTTALKSFYRISSVQPIRRFQAQFGIMKQEFFFFDDKQSFQKKVNNAYLN